MAVKAVLKMGEKSLLERSREVEQFNTAELDQLVNDMWDTMEQENGAGLAAPQIGVNLRVVIFGYESNPRYPEAPAVPHTILINPTIETLSDAMEAGWEGCLSVPGMRGVVSRYTDIRYRGFDPQGNPVDRIASGFHARVVQHECDHLDGILYPSRISDMRYFGYCEELEANDYMSAQTNGSNPAETTPAV
ncbi:MAG: peptide deformylase [Gammaproteobacteria bacterium]|nr:peptide deformylase [Gammaproteobacteria bacterium]